MLTKKQTKPTAKALAKSAGMLKTNIEFAIKPLMEDVKINDQLEKISQSLQMTEKSLEDKNRKDSVDLAKNFEKTGDELDKVIKKIQGFQEYLLLTEKSVQEKLLSRINNLKEAKKDVKDQEEYKKQADKVIIEIQVLLNNANKKVHEFSGKADEVIRHLKRLKPKMAIFSLPEDISQSDKQAKKLKDRLEALCQASTEIDFHSLSPLGNEQDKIKNFLPQLQERVKTCYQLVDQALLNLKPLMLSSAGMGASASSTATGSASASGASSTANTGSASSSASASSTAGFSSAGIGSVPNAFQSDAKNDANFKKASVS